MKGYRIVLSMVLGMALLLSGALWGFAGGGQSDGGGGQQDAVPGAVQTPLQERDQLQTQDQLRDQDTTGTHDPAQDRDRLRDQLGMPGAETSEIMNRYRGEAVLGQAMTSELNAYHQLLMLAVMENGQEVDTSESTLEMRQELKRIRLELRERVQSTYSEDAMQAMALVRNRLMAQNSQLQVLLPDALVPVGRQLHLDTPPVIENGRILVPVRALAEGFGAQVLWNAEKRQATITRGDTVLNLVQGSMSAAENGKSVQLDVAPKSMENRLYVPLRFIAEAMGCTVEWDGDEAMAILME